MPPFYPALLACLVGAAATVAHSAPTWLTLVGDPQNPTADYIQFDPMGLARENGFPTLPVRVSRVLPRTSGEGIVFHSFESVIAVHCNDKTARFVRASFYSAPDFKGNPFRTVVFAPSDIRPMAFREIKGEPTRRIVLAACNTDIKAIDPGAGSDAGLSSSTQQGTGKTSAEGMKRSLP